MCIKSQFLINTTHLINTKHEDLGINTQIMKAKIGLNLENVNAWRESIDEEGIPDGTIVYCGADSFFIEMRFAHFLNILKDFYENR